MQTKVENVNVPFQGGCKTAIDKSLLDPGQFSMIQNMRQLHPGMEKRKGQIVLHTTADGTNKVMSLYQFAKGKKVERHFYAQMSDSDVLEATNAPPTVTTGVLGSEVFSGTASPYPASWSNVDDLLLFSNGVDLPQIYAGVARYVDAFIVVKGTAALPDIPTEGEDYTNHVTGRSSDPAILDSLGDLAVDYDCLLVCTPVVAKTITWTVSKPNGTAAVMNGNYVKNDRVWTALADFADNTITTGATLAKTGTMTWTAPTDSIPSYMFGRFGYWYKFYLTTDGDLDSEVEVTSLTFESNWQSCINKWDGILVDVIEAQFYDQSAGVYKTFGGASMELDGMTSSDILYISSYEDIEAIYVDVGVTPNLNAATLTLARYNGATWDNVTKTDGSNGFTSSGWITFARGTSRQQEFNKTHYYAHWYKLTVNATLSSDVQIGMLVQPYYKLNEFGNALAICGWKGRAVYSTDRDHYLYVSSIFDPQILNGDDFTILEPGDGRPNIVVAMRQVKSDLFVWQSERGKEGGSLTKFSGDNPENFSKTVISSMLGTMNAKSVDVVDGVETFLSRDNPVMTLAFFLSKYGVYVTDGNTVLMISQDIQNYFDPKKTECIRRGYEKEHWLKYDSTYGVVRIGIVSGVDATLPNVFPVFDVRDKTWSFDSIGQELSCMEEVEAGSGYVDVLQVGGGIDDGFVYQLNTTDNDVSTAIDAYATMEFDGKGDTVRIAEIVLRLNTGAISGTTYGACTLTPYQDDVAMSAITI